MAKAYKEAVAEVVLKGPANVGVKKKRSLVGEHYYKEFSTEFWKESGIYFYSSSGHVYEKDIL